SSLHEERRDEIVHRQDEYDRTDDGVGRRSSHAQGAALAVIALIRADHRNDEAEYRRFGETEDDVLGLQKTESVAQIGVAVEAQTVHGDQIAAHDADDIGG